MSELNRTIKCHLIYSSDLVRRNQSEMVGRKVEDCSSRLGRLAWEVSEIRIERIRFPPQSKLDIHLGHASSMESDASSHSNRVRRETSKLFRVGNIVHLGGGLPKGSVDMRGTDEFNGTVLESRRSKDRKRIKVIEFQDRPTVNNTEPSRDAAKNSVVAATDASESLLFALFPIFLVAPTTIDRKNGIRSA